MGHEAGYDSLNLQGIVCELVTDVHLPHPSVEEAVVEDKSC